MRRSASILLILIFLLSMAAAAYAACSSPVANAGAQEYFSATKTYKLCDGTNWRDFNCPDTTFTATLKGYWKFDEASGTPVDQTRNNTTTTVSNITYATTSGYRDGAFSFNGTTSNVDVGSDANIDALYASNGLSISVWIYPTSTGENGNGSIIGKDSSTTATVANGWILRLTGTNRIHFAHDYVAGTNTNLVRESTDNAITLNAWNHVVLTWTGSATATTAHIYVNGTEVTYATSTDGNSTRSTDAVRDMNIGNNRTLDLSRTFAGYIDEVYIFDGILTATERSILQSRGCTRLGACATTAQMDYSTSDTAFKVCDGTNSLQLGCVATTVDDYVSGLVSHWALDATSGTSAADSVGSNTGTVGSNTGTLTNSPTWSGSGGKIAGALSFDGTDDYVDVGNPASLQITGSVTLSAWINWGTADNNDRVILAKHNASGSIKSYQM